MPSVQRPLVLLLACLASVAVLPAGDIQTNGAFVSDKADGPALEVSSTDLAPGLNADRLDGVQGFELTRSPASVVTVGNSGADFSSVRAAVDSIIDASASNPYLVFIGPGRFDESDTAIALPGHVHLRGSGAETTTLASGITIGGLTRVESLQIDAPPTLDEAARINGDHAVFFRSVQIVHDAVGVRALDQATVDIVDSSIFVSGVDDRTRFGLSASDADLRLRWVSIVAEYLGSPFNNTNAIGISAHCSGLGCPGDGSLWAENVSVIASGGTNQTLGISLGELESSRLVDSTVEIEPLQGSIGSAGLSLAQTPVQISGSRVLAHQAAPAQALRVFSAFGGAITISHSRFEALGNATTVKNSSPGTIDFYHSEIVGDGLLLDSSTADIRAVHSHLAGGSVDGPVTCRWVTDENFTAYDSGCP